MNSNEYLENMIKIQRYILDFLDNEANPDERFINLQNIFNELKIQDNIHELKSVLHILVNIGNDHHRKPNFFSKIDQILGFFKDSIKTFYSNSEIFDIFHSNKRILLFLTESQIIKFDHYIVDKILTDEKMIQNKYEQYFAPEIDSFIATTLDEEEEEEEYYEELKLPEDFEENRKIGENEHKICELIRNDSVKKFVAYVEKNHISLESKIRQSIYETNSFLMDKEVDLIEYAAFFGSIEIYKYMKKNYVSRSIQIGSYAVHGNNLDLIHLLEKCTLIQKIYIESIKCHHNEIANSIKGSVSENYKDEDYILRKILKNYNFEFLQKEKIDKYMFFDLVKYDYFILVDIQLKNENIDDLFKKKDILKNILLD